MKRLVNVLFPDPGSLLIKETLLGRSMFETYFWFILRVQCVNEKASSRALGESRKKLSMNSRAFGFVLNRLNWSRKSAYPLWCVSDGHQLKILCAEKPNVL